MLADFRKEPNMSPDAKLRLIETMCDNVKRVAMNRVQYMPDNWDGLELREYLAELFEQDTLLRRRKGSDRKRWRDYRNDVVTRFGL